MLAPLLVGAGVAGCGSGGDEPQAAPGLVTTVPGSPPPSNTIAFGTGPYLGPCLDLQDPLPPIEWLPSDLPLPDGAYAFHEFPVTGAGFETVLLAVPMADADLVRFVREEWEARGWVSGQTESEPGETEIAFLRDGRFGAVRVRPVYCDKSWTELLVVLGEQGARTG